MPLSTQQDNQLHVVLAGMQRSIEAGSLEQITLSYQERRIYHWHEELDRRIGAENVPKKLRVTPLLLPGFRGSPWRGYSCG